MGALGALGRGPLPPGQMLCTPLAGSRAPSGVRPRVASVCSCSLFGSIQEERVQDADSVWRQQQAHQQQSCTLDECFQFYTKEEQVPPWESTPLPARGLSVGGSRPRGGVAYGLGGFPSSWPRTMRGGVPTARPCSRAW